MTTLAGRAGGLGGLGLGGGQSRGGAGGSGDGLGGCGSGGGGGRADDHAGGQGRGRGGGSRGGGSCGRRGSGGRGRRSSSSRYGGDRGRRGTRATTGDLDDGLALAVGATPDCTARGDGDAGNQRVGGLAAPDAKVDGGVVGLVDAGDLGGLCAGGQGGGVGALDADLGARVVELGLAVVGAVDGDVLGAHQVLAVGQGLGHLELDLVLAVHAPAVVLQVAGHEGVLAEQRLVDLDPVARAVVRLDGPGGERHVHLRGPRVLHPAGVKGLPEPEAVARLDGEDVRLGPRAGALVAAEVVGRGRLVLEGRHVGARVLAHVLPVPPDAGPVVHEPAKGVVRARQGDGGQDRGGDGELHGCGGWEAFFFLLSFGRQKRGLRLKKRSLLTRVGGQKDQQVKVMQRCNERSKEVCKERD